MSSSRISLFCISTCEIQSSKVIVALCLREDRFGVPPGSNPGRMCTVWLLAVSVLLKFVLWFCEIL
uniref:Uncharacterized protein n=1 Tax=Arundo donax TaxID=35708 RepID=A0A0A9AUF4_ARUDO